MSRIAVTGAAGMLGAHLVDRLAGHGLDVVGVDLRPADRPVPGVRHEQADVCDTARLRKLFDGVDAVVHTASALPSYPVEQIRRVIVDGTTSVLEAATGARVDRAVHISSTAVYGLPSFGPTTERCPRGPVDPYSRAKAEAEVVCERYRASGLCLPILRPKTFLGPGRMGLFAMLFEWAEEGRHFPVLGRGDVRIQMLAMPDLLDAVEAVLRADPAVANDTYNIAAAEFGTLRQDFQAVLDAAGHGKRVIGTPAGPALAVLRALQAVRLSPVYGRLLHKLRADSYVDIEHAAQRLGFRPKLSNRDAILQTYAWWREQRQATPVRRAGGRTSRDPWRQGVLGLARYFF